MHEAAITEALVEQVRRALPEGARLGVCHIQVGELEHLDAGVMAAMWEAASEGTPLAGARLEFERVALRVRCGACGREYTPEDRAVLLCPACAEVKPHILAGTGIVLRRLEVEEA